MSRSITTVEISRGETGGGYICYWTGQKRQYADLNLSEGPKRLLKSIDTALEGKETLGIKVTSLSCHKEWNNRIR
jgi:hypothetical protein